MGLIERRLRLAGEAGVGDEVEEVVVVSESSAEEGIDLKAEIVTEAEGGAGFGGDLPEDFEDALSFVGGGRGALAARLGCGEGVLMEGVDLAGKGEGGDLRMGGEAEHEEVTAPKGDESDLFIEMLEGFEIGFLFGGLREGVAKRGVAFVLVEIFEVPLQVCDLVP